jgi:hypothetical protein
MPRATRTAWQRQRSSGAMCFGLTIDVSRSARHRLAASRPSLRARLRSAEASRYEAACAAGAAVSRVASREVRPSRSQETQRGASPRGGLSRSHTDRATTPDAACSSERCREPAGPPRSDSGRAARCVSGLTINGSRSETPPRRFSPVFKRDIRRSAEASRYEAACASRPPSKAAFGARLKPRATNNRSWR